MFKSFFTLLPQDYLVTLAMCVLACLSVGIVMRFFVKTALRYLDKFIKSKHPDDKVMAIYKTVKAIVYAILGGIFIGIALGKLMAVCPFPMDNNKALAIFYFVPMYALQWFFDAHMRQIANRLFGLEDELEEKKKVYIKKTKYTIDEDGNEVPVED